MRFHTPLSLPPDEGRDEGATHRLTESSLALARSPPLYALWSFTFGGSFSAIHPKTPTHFPFPDGTTFFRFGPKLLFWQHTENGLFRTFF